MAAPKRGLGRGLGALIPGVDPSPPADHGQHVDASSAGGTVGPVTEAAIGATYAELPIHVVVPNPRQPREVFDEDSLAELVFSIKEIGLLQPVVVRRGAGGNYELVAGERRLRACREAGLAVIPAIIRDTDDDAMLRDALLENLHRADLNALEEAAAYQQLLSDFGCTQDELARRIGRSRPQVSNTLRLLKLPPDVQRRVAAGVISAGHARALLALDDPAAMDALAQRIVAEGLSVRAVEEIVLVGTPETRKRRRRVSVPRDPDVSDALTESTERIGGVLDTTVGFEGFTTSRSRGRIVIECADASDAARIADVIAGR
ncbi:MAG: ParB/RepB/Spo0J family partition protein [Actinomycetota bacterium]|nr:ParB/RepB/Spo0J family partition protein [Actinomycetota bacterium]